ncbi:hypothetical protein KJA15_01130 [Patescibacteria group bacterium]|nr:hypothetical protein [Patescibacteria group bacterium]
MKKIFLVTIIVTLLSVASIAMAGIPDGAAGPWADEMVSFNQGNRANGTPVVPERSDPTQALGPAEGTDTINFVSLGFGGILILKFDNCILNGEGDDIDIVETSYGSPSCGAYPETVRIYASQDNSTWEDLGTSCLDGACDLGSLPWAQYIKLVDESNTSDFGGTADGFDVDGVKAIHTAEECPEEPCCGGKQINVGNRAFVINDVTAVGKTGGNKIINIASKGGSNGGNNTIRTGDAQSVAVTTTVVNSNLREPCCRGKQINVGNRAFVMNDVTAVSKTGGNRIIDVATKGGSSTGHNSITTGWVYSGSSAMTVVNSNKRGIVR